MTVPRIPRCYAHHIWHAGCEACTAERKAERLAALARLDRAAR